MARLDCFIGSRLLRFAVVGGVGFLIEACLLSYIVAQSDIGPIKGRVISFPVAVLVTWWLNRNITFKSSNPPFVESLRYFAVQTLGALANLAVFIALVSVFQGLGRLPVVPLFLAAMVGLVVNFLLSSSVVFSSHE